MEITIIHGQAHKGSSYHITERIKKNISDTNTIFHEFFMPTDAPDYCIGCYNCFYQGAQTCPHAEKVQPIIKAMEQSNVIMIDSPTYCLEMTGQLKTLFDHLGYMWLPHRPNEKMFHKVGVVVSTASGSGADSVVKSLEKQLFWLGVPVVFRFSQNVKAFSWDGVPEKLKQTITANLSKLSAKIKKNIGRTKSNFKLKFMFNIMRMMQKSNDWNPTDRNYWHEKGWLGKKRPWK